MLTYQVLDNKYTNIKELLLVYFQISNRLLIKLKKDNRILLNGHPVYITHALSKNDIVEINIDFEEKSENILPKKMDLSIVYEDDFLIIVNKDASMPVHPSISHFEDSLSNGIQYYFNTNNIKKKIRPVNRLDKDTSGLVIFAKNEYIQESLIKQMKQNIFSKEYIAVLEGYLKQKIGTINAPISRKDGSIIEREISENGDIAITHFNLIENYEFQEQPLSLVKFKLETGRTHQIRLHCKYIGHPIVGDFLYGNESNLIKRHALHAYRIEFIHPITKTKMIFEIPLANDIKEITKNILFN